MRQYGKGLWSGVWKLVECWGPFRPSGSRNRGLPASLPISSRSVGSPSPEPDLWPAPHKFQTPVVGQQIAARQLTVAPQGRSRPSGPVDRPVSSTVQNTEDCDNLALVAVNQQIRCMSDSKLTRVAGSADASQARIGSKQFRRPEHGRSHTHCGGGLVSCDAFSQGVRDR